MPASKRKRGSWEEIAKEAQRHRDTTISQLKPRAYKTISEMPKNMMNIPKQHLSQKDWELTNIPLEQLISSLQTGQVSAVEITNAYLQRAATAQGLSNCLTELLPRKALKRAKELDAYFKQHQQPAGPLHGLPISIKEHICFRGLRCTTGYVSHWDIVAKEDAHIIQVLHNAGAVFHCRTTVPQTMMHLETDSNLYGVTTNPYNSNLTSGGSSGGEGALVALGGSCLGVGSDVGGSIRSPAANCGIYGLKPTGFRIPTDGWGYMMAGADTIESVIGPLSSSLAGLKLFMKTVIDSQPWLAEPALVPIPWREYDIPQGRPLKIGVLWHDDIVRPHPPITRALKMMTNKLKEQDFEVVDFPAHCHAEAWAIIVSLYFTDAGKANTLDIEKSGEPWRPLSKWIINENTCVKSLSVDELSHWLEEREAYRKEYALYWNKLGVDALLCPVGPGVAPKHDTAKYWNYTSQWNLLDYPSVAFPVCLVDKELDVLQDDTDEWSEKDSENKKLWDKDEFHGVPVGLQLVGRRFDDEKILAILQHIQDKIKLPFTN